MPPRATVRTIGANGPSRLRSTPLGHPSPVDSRLALPGPVDPDRFDTGGGFVVSTGIECSAPVTTGGVRIDELRLTGHWERYAEDFGLVASFGMRFLRFGIPFHVVAATAGAHDWSWTDAALDSMRRAGVEPVADLLHFGLPGDLSGFGDPAMPARYLAYVEAFLARYPWVRWFTPVNEPYISAAFSAHHGWWNERRTDDASFVAALANVAACTVDGMARIRARRPDAVFLQSDVCESFLPGHQDATTATAFLAARRFVTFDLAYGRLPASPVVDWLLRNGMDELRLARLVLDGSAEGCIAGLDYYQANEHLVAIDGTVSGIPAAEQRGFAAVAREYHDHLGVPFMLAETNAVTEAAPAWLAATWNDALILRAEGRPIRGYCWYSLTDQVDWNTCLRVPAGHVDSLGLVDLDRRIRPVGERYRALALAARQGRLEPIELASDGPADPDGLEVAA
jgi:beta-glucosidase